MGAKSKKSKPVNQLADVSGLIADFQLLDAATQRTDFTQSDTWRIFRIMGEFVHGIEVLSKVGPGVVIFGSARTKRSDPYYKAAMKTAEILARLRRAFPCPFRRVCHLMTLSECKGSRLGTPSLLR